jgi:hypothetical protein
VVANAWEAPSTDPSLVGAQGMQEEGRAMQAHIRLGCIFGVNIGLH